MEASMPDGTGKKLVFCIRIAILVHESSLYR